MLAIFVLYVLVSVPLSACDVLTFFEEMAWKTIVVVTYTCRTSLMAMFDPGFTCVKS